MSAISETIVREYFELRGFFVRQQRKYVAPSRREEDEADFFVWNPLASSDGAALPFILGDDDLRRVPRAMVVVKGWHTDTFSPGLLANAPEIFRFLEPVALKRAAQQFGDAAPVLKLLVVPALPASDEAREQSIGLLRAKGIDGVIPFRAMLASLVASIETNRNYQKSDLLQTLRILKNYDFVREPQLELFKPRRPRKARNEGGAGVAEK
jgi:hypothetical protein